MKTLTLYNVLARGSSPFGGKGVCVGSYGELEQI
jgi:hypothetical protein